jgi:GNAT superfamily N-acetyltransferase
LWWKESIVELHEIWLIEKYRGKGYGKRFFEFFEEFIRRKGYDSLVYYADHPSCSSYMPQKRVHRRLFGE